MDSSANKQRFYAFAQTEWSNYTKYRPAYPPSLIEIIKSHHQRYCGSYNFAHDVGSGSGIFVPALAQDFGFKHVHVSDVGKPNIKTSRELLSRWVAMQREVSQAQTTLTFSVVDGEEMHTCTTARSVDLVTVMEAAHWMDGPRMMASAAETLAPEGTIAIVIYCGFIHIKHNARANTAFKDALGAIIRYSVGVKRASNTIGLSEFERGLEQASVGLDWLTIDGATWKNVRRIRIRGGGKGEFPHDLNYTSEPHFAPSNVHLNQKYDHYEEQDEEASGWEVEVDRDWFYGYLTSFEDPDHVVRLPEYQILVDVLAEEFPLGRILVEWTTDIVLASRRE